MTATNLKKRTDKASKFIAASAQRIYEAFLNKRAIKIWRPPTGMKCEVYEFEPKPNGMYKMSFSYLNQVHDVPGKTTPHKDVFTGKFVALVPNKRIVELVEFESSDPEFSGPMTVTTILEPLEGGTEVTFVVDNVPPGIKKEDHHKGMESTLNNLAAFVS